MWCRWQLFSLCAVVVVQQINADVCKDTKPAFSAPGRRISEQKCHEFNWERKRLEKCSKDAVNMKYPFMGALGYKKYEGVGWSFLCASFLISPKYVVTTALCLRSPLEGAPKIVRFGNDNIKDEVPRLDVKIRRLIRHPKYKYPLKYYDIGLIELETEVPFTKNTYPACLWTQASLDGVEFGGNPAWASEVLRGEQRDVIAEMKVKFVDQKICSEILKTWYTRNFRELQDHQMCGNDSVSAILNCHGSAGAPLITKVDLDGNSEDQMPYAFAMTVFSRGCGDMTIYARIASFIDWIEQIVWLDDEGSKIHFKE